MSAISAEGTLLMNALLDGMGGEARIPGSDVAAHMPTLYMFAHHWSFGAIVELGVYRAWSTVALLAGAVSAGSQLFSYDHYDHSPKLLRNLGMSPDHPLLRAWQFRVKDSVDAAEDFVDGSVSCWFLDTIHTLDHTRKELEAWLPKLHARGLMCGHDYLLDEFDGLRYGVRQAVDEFAEKHRDRFALQVLPYDCGLFVLRPRD